MWSKNLHINETFSPTFEYISAKKMQLSMKYISDDSNQSDMNPIRIDMIWYWMKPKKKIA